MAMSELFVFFKDDRARPAGMIRDRLIAGGYDDAVKAANCAKSRQDFLKHEPGQRFPLRWRQETLQPLLGVYRGLDG